MMVVLSEVPIRDLVNDGNLNKQICLPCPVTGQMTMFNDFDIVAFYPAAGDKAWRLYDPLMATPVSCANLSSDIYAFSMLASDQSLALYGCEVWEIPDNETRRNLFEKNSSSWQRFAMRTINNYIQITDSQRCPTFLTDDHRHWYANHQDPAFAETYKNLYRHDMPVIYLRRLIQSWMNYYKKGVLPNLDNVTEPGTFDQCPRQ